MFPTVFIGIEPNIISPSSSASVDCVYACEEERERGMVYVCEYVRERETVKERALI